MVGREVGFQADQGGREAAEEEEGRERVERGPVAPRALSLSLFGSSGRLERLGLALEPPPEFSAPYRYARVRTPCQLTKKEKGVRWQRGVAEMRDSSVGAGPAARGESNAPSWPSSCIALAAAAVAMGGGAVAGGIEWGEEEGGRPCRPVARAKGE